MSGVDGLATSEGTRGFRERAQRERRIPPDHFRSGPGSLELTSLGLGTYIGPPDAPTDIAVEQAVSLSLASGRVNVFDTAINYRYQRAERSVGRGLARSFERGTARREEVFVATKNGYFAPDGESKVPADEWVEVELIRKGRLDPADIVDGCHAMSVPYLTDQFERSRVNLGLSGIDLLYLHNAPDAQLPTVGRSEFLRRLSDAFALLEKFRDDGRLQYYGLATWDCLRTKRSDPGYLALSDAVAVARTVGGESHGFRFLQFPFNFAMPEAAAVANQPVNGARHPLFRAASELGLSCFTSVPLFQGQLARSGPAVGDLTPAQSAIQFARSAPGTIGPLVGQKTPEHLAENLKVADSPPWDAATFDRLLR